MREAVRLAVRRCATLWTGKKPMVEVMLLQVAADDEIRLDRRDLFPVLRLSAFLLLPFGVRTDEEIGQAKVPGQADSAPHSSTYDRGGDQGVALGQAQERRVVDVDREHERKRVVGRGRVGGGDPGAELPAVPLPDPRPGRTGGGGQHEVEHAAAEAAGRIGAAGRVGQRVRPPRAQEHLHRARLGSRRHGRILAGGQEGTPRLDRNQLRG